MGPLGMERVPYPDVSSYRLYFVPTSPKQCFLWYTALTFSNEATFLVTNGRSCLGAKDQDGKKEKENFSGEPGN